MNIADQIMRRADRAFAEASGRILIEDLSPMERKAEDDAIETKARYVRTPAGVRRFKRPIGSIILPRGMGSLDQIRYREPKFKGFDLIEDRKGNLYDIGKDPASGGKYVVLKHNTWDDQLPPQDTLDKALAALNEKLGGGTNSDAEEGEKPAPKTKKPAPKKTPSKEPSSGSEPQTSAPSKGNTSTAEIVDGKFVITTPDGKKHTRTATGKKPYTHALIRKNKEGSGSDRYFVNFATDEGKVHRESRIGAADRAHNEIIELPTSGNDAPKTPEPQGDAPASDDNVASSDPRKRSAKFKRAADNMDRALDAVDNAKTEDDYRRALTDLEKSTGEMEDYIKSKGSEEDFARSALPKIERAKAKARSQIKRLEAKRKDQAGAGASGKAAPKGAQGSPERDAFIESHPKIKDVTDYHKPKLRDMSEKNFEAYVAAVEGGKSPNSIGPIMDRIDAGASWNPVTEKWVGQNSTKRPTSPTPTADTSASDAADAAVRDRVQRMKDADRSKGRTNPYTSSLKPHQKDEVDALTPGEYATYMNQRDMGRGHMGAMHALRNQPKSGYKGSMDAVDSAIKRARKNLSPKMSGKEQLAEIQFRERELQQAHEDLSRHSHTMPEKLDQMSPDQKRQQAEMQKKTQEVWEAESVLGRKRAAALEKARKEEAERTSHTGETAVAEREKMNAIVNTRVVGTPDARVAKYDALIKEMDELGKSITAIGPEFREARRRLHERRSDALKAQGDQRRAEEEAERQRQQAEKSKTQATEDAARDQKNRERIQDIEGRMARTQKYGRSQKFTESNYILMLKVRNSEDRESHRAEIQDRLAEINTRLGWADEQIGEDYNLPKAERGARGKALRAALQKDKERFEGILKILDDQKAERSKPSSSDAPASVDNLTPGQYAKYMNRRDAGDGHYKALAEANGQADTDRARLDKIQKTRVTGTPDEKVKKFDDLMKALDHFDKTSESGLGPESRKVRSRIAERRADALKAQGDQRRAEKTAERQRQQAEAGAPSSSDAPTKPRLDPKDMPAPKIATGPVKKGKTRYVGEVNGHPIAVDSGRKAGVSHVVVLHQDNDAYNARTGGKAEDTGVTSVIYSEHSSAAAAKRAAESTRNFPIGPETRAYVVEVKPQEARGDGPATQVAQQSQSTSSGASEALKSEAGEYRSKARDLSKRIRDALSDTTSQDEAYRDRLRALDAEYVALLPRNRQIQDAHFGSDKATQDELRGVANAAQEMGRERNRLATRLNGVNIALERQQSRRPQAKRTETTPSKPREVSSPAPAQERVKGADSTVSLAKTQAQKARRARTEKSARDHINTLNSTERDLNRTLERSGDRMPADQRAEVEQALQEIRAARAKAEENIPLNQRTHLRPSDLPALRDENRMFGTRGRQDPELTSAEDLHEALPSKSTGRYMEYELDMDALDQMVTDGTAPSVPEMNRAIRAMEAESRKPDGDDYDEPLKDLKRARDHIKERADRERAEFEAANTSLFGDDLSIPEPTPAPRQSPAYTERPGDPGDGPFRRGADRLRRAGVEEFTPNQARQVDEMSRDQWEAAQGRVDAGESISDVLGSTATRNRRDPMAPPPVSRDEVRRRLAERRAAREAAPRPGGSTTQAAWGTSTRTSLPQGDGGQESDDPIRRAVERGEISTREAERRRRRANSSWDSYDEDTRPQTSAEVQENGRERERQLADRNARTLREAQQAQEERESYMASLRARPQFSRGEYNRQAVILALVEGNPIQQVFGKDRRAAQDSLHSIVRSFKPTAQERATATWGNDQRIANKVKAYDEGVTALRTIYNVDDPDLQRGASTGDTSAPRPETTLGGQEPKTPAGQSEDRTSKTPINIGNFGVRSEAEARQMYANTPRRDIADIPKGGNGHIGNGVWVKRCPVCGQAFKSVGVPGYSSTYAKHVDGHGTGIAIPGYNVGMLS